jgi:hypothetical protein
MTTVKTPTGVVGAVFIVTTVEQLGVQESCENEAEAPSGSPAADKKTVPGIPDTRLAVMFVVAIAP